MSDGGKESGIESEHGSGGSGRRKQGGSDEYGRAITKIAVAQICESVGFQSFQQSALDVLSEVTIRYLCDLGKTAHFYTNLSGRSDCNALDIIQGLEDFVSWQGFSAASDINRSLAGSGTVREIIQYVNSEEIPFARDVAHFPVIKNRKPAPSFNQIGEKPDGDHIPPWLPAFPDSHTYVHTPVWNGRTTDPRSDKIEQAKQRRKEERSLLSLQQRLACNGSSGFTLMNTVDDGKVTKAAESNPFLTPPLQFGEKDVPPVVPPAQFSNERFVNTRSSVLETFAPAIGTVNTGVCNSSDDDRKVLPNKRPIVNFKLSVSKKSLGVPLDLALQKESLGETTQLTVRGYEKDEKKRRAEKILKESMDNSRELS